MIEFKYDMKKHICILIILLNIINLNSQNEKPNREPFVLEIAIDSINFYRQNVEKSPYFVKDKLLQIYPSENIFVETEIKNDSIYSMKVVKNNLNPEKTITISFIQEVKGKESERMVLRVTNPFNRTLKYNALMFVNGGSDWIPTSIIPVRPKLMTIEMWNDIILSLVLVEWKIE